MNNFISIYIFEARILHFLSVLIETLLIFRRFTWSGVDFISTVDLFDTINQWKSTGNLWRDFFAAYCCGCARLGARYRGLSFGFNTPKSMKNIIVLPLHGKINRFVAAASWSHAWRVTEKFPRITDFDELIR